MAGFRWPTVVVVWCSGFDVVAVVMFFSFAIFYWLRVVSSLCVLNSSCVCLSRVQEAC